MKSSKLRTLLVWSGLVVLMAWILITLDGNSKPKEVSFEVLLRRIETGEVVTYSLNAKGLEFTTLDSSDTYFCRIPWNSPSVANSILNGLPKRVEEKETEVAEDQAELQLHPMQRLALALAEAGAVSNVDRPKNEWSTSDFAVWIGLPVAVIVIVIFLIRRASMGAQSNIFAMRNSQAKLAEESSKVKFDDIGGCEEAKEELGDLVTFLRSPERWKEAGARLPRGILLEGSPGCGKTLLARAVAGETSAKFYHTSASEFVEMFVGIGAARVRDMFETARKNAPAVLFIDEIDAIGRRRGSGVGVANEEREQTLNQLLVCLDGFQENDRVVVIGATNRADILDKALVRSGRMDRRILIPPLNCDARLDVLQIHTRGMPLDAGLDLSEVAQATGGYSGADLEGLANLAAQLAVRRLAFIDQPILIQQSDFVLALKKRNEQQHTFDSLDAVLFEATTQLAEPVGRAVVRVNLENGTTIEGDVVWADPNFVKIRRSDANSTCIIPKHQISNLEALQGTAFIDENQVQIDRSQSQAPKFA